MGTASFRLDIKPEWEKAIQQGLKTIDVRENVQPYADVNKGDVIHYRSAKVKVTGIRAYAGLNDLFTYEKYKKIVPEAKDKNEAIRKMMEVAPHVDQAHGILAFEIELLKK
ncbi:MAG: ASCH domain-containing protein [Nitrospirota bacterium]